MCEKCKDTGWVCEDHHDRTWETGLDSDCDCGGAGQACECNPEGKLPQGMKVTFTNAVWGEDEHYVPEKPIVH